MQDRKTSRNIQNSIFCIAFALDVIILDQITKWLVLKGIIPETQNGLLDITLVWNDGIAFGIQIPQVLWIALFVIILLGLSSFYREHALYTKFGYMSALGLVLGGAVGNGIDRIVHGSVVDFINLHFWPVFNVADSAIVIGVLLMLVLQYRDARKS